MVPVCQGEVKLTIGGGEPEGVTTELSNPGSGSRGVPRQDMNLAHALRKQTPLPVHVLTQFHVLDNRWT
jgi:hypothetical protein